MNKFNELYESIMNEESSVKLLKQFHARLKKDKIKVSPIKFNKEFGDSFFTFDYNGEKSIEAMASNDSDEVIITKTNDEQAVLKSMRDYNSLLEYISWHPLGSLR